MKALVTGSTGFIGSHLVEALLDRGYDVRVLLRPSSNAQSLGHLKVEAVRGSFDDAASLEPAVDGVDIVFHCAGVVASKDRAGFFRGNVDSTRNLLDAIESVNPGLRRFVHVSSLAAVGPSPGEHEPVDETVPWGPITTYGESKAAAERIVTDRMERVAATIVRPPVVYGPRDVGVYTFFQTVSRGFTPLIGFDRKLVSMIHVEDLVQGFILAAEAEAAEGETYFITSDRFYTWEEVGRATTKLFGRERPRFIRVPHPLVFAVAGLSGLIGRFQKKPPILDFEKGRDITQRYWTCSAEKARRELGFEAAIDIERGVASTVEWYRSNGWL